MSLPLTIWRPPTRRWRPGLSAGEKREALFLTRLALLLAHEIGDIAAFRRAVQTALEELP